jgi:pimeloyl-ACP methyl ester carboxylesterase
MPTARINGIDIWYERSGQEAPLSPSGRGAGGEGKPVVMLTHGFAGPASAGWPPIVDGFKRRYDVITYDVRAHGRTTVPEDESTVTVPQFAADLDALMEHLGIDRAHVAGISMGGMISAQFACDFPHRLRSLLLCDTIAGNGAGADEKAVEVERLVENAMQRIAHLAEKYGVEEVVARESKHRHEVDQYAPLAVKTLEEQDEENYDHKVRHMTRRGFVASARAMHQRPDLTSRTPDITAPALISCGEWDLFYPGAVRDAALIPNRRLVTIRRSAHDTLAYQPHLWFQSVTTFIDDVEAGRDVKADVILDPEK